MLPEVPSISAQALADVTVGLLVVSLALTGAIALAAVVLHARAEHVERRRARRTARWTPRLLALLDGDVSAEAFAASIRPHQRDDMLRFLTTYAVRVKGGDRRRLAAAAAPLLSIARRRLTSRSPEWRAFGVHALGLLSEDAPLVTLGTALRDPSRRVGLAAARALAQTQNPLAARVMLTALSRFGGAHKANVTSLLTQFGLRAGEPIREAVVHRRTDPLARVAAIEALEQLSYVPASGDARALLTRPDVDRETRAALLRFLGAVGGSKDAAAVRPFCDSPDDVLRIHAVGALGRLQCGPEDTWRLRQALKDPNGWVALRASEALGRPLAAPPPPRRPSLTEVHA